MISVRTLRCLLGTNMGVVLACSLLMAAASSVAGQSRATMEFRGNPGDVLSYEGDVRLNMPFEATIELTLSCWSRPTEMQVVLSRESDAMRDYAVGIMPGGTSIALTSDRGTITAPCNFLDGRFHHVAFVIGSGHVKAYVDGEIRTDQLSDTPFANPETGDGLPFNVGGTTNGHALSGSIASVRLWSAELTADQLDQLAEVDGQPSGSLPFIDSLAAYSVVGDLGASIMYTEQEPEVVASGADLGESFAAMIPDGETIRRIFVLKRDGKVIDVAFDMSGGDNGEQQPVHPGAAAQDEEADAPASGSAAVGVRRPEELIEAGYAEYDLRDGEYLVGIAGRRDESVIKNLRFRTTERILPEDVQPDASGEFQPLVFHHRIPYGTDLRAVVGFRSAEGLHAIGLAYTYRTDDQCYLLDEVASRRYIDTKTPPPFLDNAGARSYTFTEENGDEIRPYVETTVIGMTASFRDSNGNMTGTQFVPLGDLADFLPTGNGLLVMTKVKTQRLRPHSNYTGQRLIVVRPQPMEDTVRLYYVSNRMSLSDGKPYASEAKLHPVEGMTSMFENGSLKYLLTPDRLYTNSISSYVAASAYQGEDLEDKLAWGATFTLNERPTLVRSNFRGYGVPRMNPRSFMLDTETSPPLFAYPDESSRSYRTTDSNIIIPYGLYFVVDNEGDEETTSTTVSNKREYQRAEGYSVGADVGGSYGAFSASAGYQRDQDDMFGGSESRESSWELASTNQTRYALVADFGHIQLDPDFEAAILDMRDAYVAGVWYDVKALLHRFGTHYPYAVTYGGTAKLEAEYTKAAREELESHNLSQGVHASMSVGTVSVSGSYSEFSKVSDRFQTEMSHSRRRFWTLGGSIARGEGWSLPRGEEAPIMFDLRPLDELLSPVFFDDPIVWEVLRPQVAAVIEAEMSHKEGE